MKTRFGTKTQSQQALIPASTPLRVISWGHIVFRIERMGGQV